jgi:5'-3' exonuclease
MQHYIFIDGSYFVFHRFHALKKWWKSAKPDEPLNGQYPSENPLFVEKFKKTFVENIRTIPKKIGLPKNAQPIFIVGKDCRQANIWRNALYPEYKSTRNSEMSDPVVPFFRMAYDEDGGLFAKANIQHIFQHPQLEADDCIAIAVKHLLKTTPETQIQIDIFTGDHDYLQLVQENVSVYNLSYKKIPSLGKEKDLFCKVVKGDPSDNIPSIFKSCGIKTAIKCYEDPEFFKQKLEKDKTAKYNYERNETLISFEKIPETLQQELYDSYVVKLIAGNLGLLAAPATPPDNQLG